MSLNTQPVDPKTHCSKGHAFTPENTRKSGTCKACALVRDRLGRRRRRWQNPARWRYEECKRAARKHGIEFTIKITDLLPLPKVCPVLGIPLNYGERYIGRDHWPSVDRRDPKKGYTPGNIAIMSYRANRMKNNSTLEEMENLVAWMKGSTWPHTKSLTPNPSQVDDSGIDILDPAHNPSSFSSAGGS